MLGWGKGSCPSVPGGREDSKGSASHRLSDDLLA